MTYGPSQPIDLDQLDIDELIAERERLKIEKDENYEILLACRAQIAAAEGRRIAGDGFDPRWFASVRTRARYAGRADQILADRLGDLRLRIARARKELPGADELELLDTVIRLLGQARDLIRARQEDRND